MNTKLPATFTATCLGLCFLTAVTSCSSFPLAPIGEGAIVINEVMSSNLSNIRDEDAGFSDWMELRNVSDKMINLRGSFLSDKKSELNKWSFPDVILGPGRYLVVFASGR